jgi:type VI secretion system protein ImpJ
MTQSTPIMNADFLPDAVQWSEGMLLSPQHFQQNDIHLQAMLHQRFTGAVPYGWGLRHLRIDEARLADGIVCVHECDAVMPDGLPLVYRATHVAGSLAVDVKKLFEGDAKSVRVYLAIPPRAGALDVPSTSIRRFDSLPGRPTLDETVGMGDVVVERQRVRVELYAGAPPVGHPALPLLDVVRDASEALAIGTYHGPMLRIDASRALGANGLQQRFSDLRAAMWKKLRELSPDVTDDAPETAAAMGTEARTHLRAAREIGACLPLVDTVLADPLVSPSVAWWAMSQVVGRMAAIGSNPRPLAMDPYRHDDCQPQFDAALTYIRRKLAMLNTDWDVMAFERVADGQFARRLPDDSGSTVLVELRVGEGQSAHDLRQWLSEARIASEDLLPLLRQRRLPGADLRVLGAREIAELGLRHDAMICALRSQPLETASGLVDCFRGGHRLVVQGERTQAPAAIILHHRKGADPRQAAAPRAQAGMQGGMQSSIQSGMQTGMSGDSHA